MLCAVALWSGGETGDADVEEDEADDDAGHADAFGPAKGGGVGAHDGLEGKEEDGKGEGCSTEHPEDRGGRSLDRDEGHGDVEGKPRDERKIHIQRPCGTVHRSRGVIRIGSPYPTRKPLFQIRSHRREGEALEQSVWDEKEESEWNFGQRNAPPEHNLFHRRRGRGGGWDVGLGVGGEEEGECSRWWGG